MRAVSRASAGVIAIRAVWANPLHLEAFYRRGQVHRHLGHWDEALADYADMNAALGALEGDHEFLLRGDVFTEDVISTWIDYKRENEVDAIRLRPHPHEFALYFDV